MVLECLCGRRLLVDDGCVFLVCFDWVVFVVFLYRFDGGLSVGRFGACVR